MSVGGRLLAACCANGGLSNNQIPTCPFTTIACEYSETNTFITSSLVFKLTQWSTNHPGCQFSQYPTEWASRGSGSGSGSEESYNLLNTGSGNARWDLASSTITTGSGGPVVRPGTNTVVAASPQFKFRRCVYNRVSRFRTYRVGSQISGQTSYTAYGDCCASSAFTYDFDNVVTGPVVNQTTPSSAASYTIDWAGVASERVAGMTLVLTAAGLAAGPWVVEVAGGVLKLTNGAGTTTTYSGLLTAVRTSINSAGFFTATITAQARTPAETQDLKQSKSQPLSTACTHSLYIIDIGDLIAPGSGDGTVPPVRLSAGSPFVIQLRFDAAAEGLPNNIAGLESFLRRTWFPKIAAYAGIGGLASVTTSYLGVTTANWSTTSGVSTKTQDYLFAGTLLASIQDYNGVCATCEGSCNIGNSSWPGPFSPSNCQGFLDCNGNQVPPPTCDCITEFFASAAVYTAIPVTVNDMTFTGTQTITGSFQIS